MTYEESPPCAALAAALASHWRFALAPDHPPGLHRVPPDGLVNLCWVPPGRAVLVGPRLAALRVPVAAGAEYRGVRFLPGAARALLGVASASIREQVVPFDDERVARALSAGPAAVESLFVRLGWEGPDPAVFELTRRILVSDGTAPVGDLTAGFDLSYRQLLRRFYEAAGLTPKEFARLRRLRAACLEAVASAEPSWAAVSAGAGFADQSHLAREFRGIFGWPPRLVHEYLRQIEHRWHFSSRQSRPPRLS